jgi:hypothetical protein
MYNDLFAITKFAEETQYREIQREAFLNYFLSYTAFRERYRSNLILTYYRLDATTLLTA